MHIFHDNSGKGWFLKCAIVHDLQTREENVFIYEKWLALDKGDECIDAVIAVSGDKQKTSFIYLLKKNSKQRLTDNHLWFSVFSKPVKSTFTRLQRVTCCFVLLCLTMLMNILYYDIVGNSDTTSSIQIGPIKISIQQVDLKVIFKKFSMLTKIRTKKFSKRINEEYILRKKFIF